MAFIKQIVHSLGGSTLIFCLLDTARDNLFCKGNAMQSYIFSHIYHSLDNLNHSQKAVKNFLIQFTLPAYHIHIHSPTVNNNLTYLLGNLHPKIILRHQNANFECA